MAEIQFLKRGLDRSRMDRERNETREKLELEFRSRASKESCYNCMDMIVECQMKEYQEKFWKQNCLVKEAEGNSNKKESAADL